MLLLLNLFIRRDSNLGKVKLPINDRILEKWLDEEFKSERTKGSYLSAIRKFKKALDLDSLKEYLDNKPDVISDLRTFAVSLDGKPSKTIATYMGVVKVFLQDHGFETSGKTWKKFRKRGFLPKRVKAETQDKKPSKSELKRILDLSRYSIFRGFLG